MRTYLEFNLSPHAYQTSKIACFENQYDAFYIGAENSSSHLMPNEFLELQKNIKNSETAYYTTKYDGISINVDLYGINFCFGDDYVEIYGEQFDELKKFIMEQKLDN